MVINLKFKNAFVLNEKSVSRNTPLGDKLQSRLFLQGALSAEEQMNISTLDEPRKMIKQAREIIHIINLQ
jgi:hypothetical protein